MRTNRSSTYHSIWRSQKTAGAVGIVLYRRTIVVDFQVRFAIIDKKSKNGQQSSTAIMRKREVITEQSKITISQMELASGSAFSYPAAGIIAKDASIPRPGISITAIHIPKK